MQTFLHAECLTRTLLLIQCGGRSWSCPNETFATNDMQRCHWQKRCTKQSIGSSRQHHVCRGVCECVKAFAHATHTCSQGTTTWQYHRAGYKQVRDQQVTRSFPSQPACNEWCSQIIQSVTALIRQRGAKEARPQDKDLQAVLCAPPFCDCLGSKTAQKQAPSSSAAVCR